MLDTLLMLRYNVHRIAFVGAAQTRAYTLEYRSGTPEGQQFVENQKRIFRTALPFLRKWLRVPDNYDEMYQQMLTKLQQPGFVATWDLLTVWGRKSSRT